MSLLDRLRQALGVSRGTPRRGAHAVTRIEYDRQPLAEWQASLDALHIPGTARLIVAWEPGDVWQPIHRWMLWQLQPWHLNQNTALKNELRGPHPRSRGHYCGPETGCQCVDEFGQRVYSRTWKGGPSTLIDRRQYELHWAHYKATGELVVPRRFWVIQGDAGGHPFTVSMSEQKWRREHGMAPDVPSASDLPYVEFDRRVLTALERYDLWRYAAGLGDPLTNVAKATLARMHATEVEAHKVMWSRWQETSEAWADGAAFAARQDGLHYHRWRPVGEKARGFDMDAIRAAYLNDTDVEAVA